MDGEIHKYKLRKDKLRSNIINLLGIDVIRFRNEEVEKDIDEVIHRIESYISSKKYIK